MRYITIVFFLFTEIHSISQAKQQLDSLTVVLEKISVDDQKYRNVWDSTMQRFGIGSPEFIDLIKKMNTQDSINMVMTGNILDVYGWLGKEQVSADASEALFLVLQHAELESQLKYLPMMKQAVADKKAKGSSYTLLVDRTKMRQGKFQVYGSQLNYDAKGRLHIFPIADEPNLNKRRQSIGLPPMQAYLDLFNQQLHYTLPKTDPYKNRIVITGTLSAEKDKQPLANVSIYNPANQLIGKTDSSGFYQVIIDLRNKKQAVVFKKQGYETLEFKLPDMVKDVFEIKFELQQK